MTFDEAMAKCQPGQQVNVHGAPWNEYHMQYGRHEDGRAYWTAGGTCGGDLTVKGRPPETDTRDWRVYALDTATYTYREVK